jgi:thiol-disulfide isomerase/thioredoxin
MDRLRHLAAAFAILLASCHEEPPSGEAPSRFQSVKGERSQKAKDSFCENQFPAKGEGSRAWAAPPERPVPGRSAHAAEPGAGWTWINLWASWCVPCLKEVPLLGRWGDTLRKEGVPVRFEFWSVDEDEAELKGALAREFPGTIRWLKSSGDLPKLLESLGVDKGSAIPVHALVDREGMIRCVRVGSVGEDAYGSVRAILSGG